jgi:hypothetical protein
MNTRTQQILLHVTGWMVFLTLPLLFSPESLSLHAYLTNPPTQRDLLAYLMVVVIFYLNFYWLIPRLYFRKKYLSFFLVGLLCFIPVIFLPGYLVSPPPFPGPPPDEQIPFPARPPGHSPYTDLSQHLFLFLGMLFLALLLKIRDRWKQTEKDQLRAELSYLKAQINPHFLFNSLNSIYALAIEKSDQAPEAIVKLSEMMRYILNETGKEWVPLEKEISYIRNYIALQQTRFGSSIPLDFQIPNSSSGHLPETSSNFPIESPFEGLKIAPLILIPFIENAFKHGVNAEENSNIRILIDINGSSLHLLAVNNKVTVRQPVDSHSGLGIGNTKQRLRLLYPGDHILDIRDNAHDFQVSLTLKLK